MKCDDSLYLPVLLRTTALVASCEDYNRLAVITVHTRTRMYLQDDCYMKRNQNAIYIYVCVCVCVYPLSYLANLPHLGSIRPGGSDDVHSTVTFPRSRKTRSLVVDRFTRGRNCPLPREKVTDQSLRSTWSSSNLPPNDARELPLCTPYVCV